MIGSGGALRLLCSVSNSRNCRFSIENNSFVENTALKSGGAIYYDLYSPKNLSENTFIQNIANYGKSIGSYAFRLKIINNSDGDEINLKSGEITQEDLTLGIFD